MLKIAIDAGHYINTPGKRCLKSLDAAQTREWTLNNRIAVMLENLLKSYDCAILRVDDPTGKKDVTLSERCSRANAWGANVYLSIHHNAGVNGGSGGGTVVFYYSSKAERKEQAQALYNALVSNTGLIGNRASKVVNKAYAVLKGTKMPAFLIENGFMDSKTDVPIILTEEHAKKTAQGCLDFLRSAFNLALKSQGGTNIPKNDFKPYTVKITVDALNVRSGAGLAFDINTVVHKNEVYTIVEVCRDWGKLKSGAGWINLNYTTRK